MCMVTLKKIYSLIFLKSLQILFATELSLEAKGATVCVTSRHPCTAEALDAVNVVSRFNMTITHEIKESINTD